MSLRIGVDLDGTLADLSSMYHRYERELFGELSNADAADIDETAPAPTDKQKLKAAKARTRRQDAVWSAVRKTPDFWKLLDPIEDGAIPALYQVAMQQKWEVFFITQRPKSAGLSVQQQTQEWLIANGYPTPSVLTLSGSRGKAAQALDLDFLIDDLPKNCVDVISDSKCRPILVLRSAGTAGEESARRMNIGVVRSVADAIALLSQPTPEPRQTSVQRVLKLLGLTK